MTPPETPPDRILSLDLTPLFLIAVLVVLLSVVLYVNVPDKDDGEGMNKAAQHTQGVTVYPTPAPVTFIVPSPIPPTPLPTRTPPSQQVLNLPAPAFDLPLLDGNTVTLEDFRGEIVLLNFWATWCAPCEVEMPLLQSLHESGAVRVIAVTDPTDGQGEDTIRAFMARYDLTMPVALVSDITVYATFEVAQIPMTYIIDRAGIVRFVHVGVLDEHDVYHYLAHLGA